MTIFVTGASGYIGGSIAAALAAHGHAVTGLIRDPNQEETLRRAGIHPVRGDLALPESYLPEARQAEVIINAADSDHTPAIHTLLDVAGATGALLLHTSGSSIVSDAASGEPSDTLFPEESIYDPAWKPHPDKLARVQLDRTILNSAATGNVRAAVICNTMIVGDGAHPHRRSVQLPRLVQYARARGAAPQIGRGLNRWSTVWIDDVVELYRLAITDAQPGDFVFAEASEIEFVDIAQSLADALHTPVRSLSRQEGVDEWGHEFAIHAFGSNSRVRDRHARENWGWSPRPVTVEEAVEAEIRAARSTT